MPSRNITKVQVPESYYHVYARGSNKQKIFLEVADYKYFLNLFERYFASKPQWSKTGEPYPNYVGHIELLAHCLMSNHFHLLIYQYDIPSLEKFMRSLMTSYSRYFNLKYRRTGSLFESRYKAVLIEQDSYLQHVSRYIHLNPRRWQTYRYSSLQYYRDGLEPMWLKTNRLLEMFADRADYMAFVADYEEQHDMLDELKYQLAVW